MIKLQKDKRTVIVVSVYASQQVLTNNEKDCFYESNIKLIVQIRRAWLSLVVTLMDM